MSDVYFREHDQCAIADLVKQVNELQQENQQQAVRIERLRVHAREAVDRLRADENPYADVLNRIVKQTPQQSLAAIQADAVVEMADFFEKNMKANGWMTNISFEEIDEYVKSLRDKA